MAKNKTRHTGMMKKVSALALAALSIGATAPAIPSNAAQPVQQTQNKSATPVKETKVMKEVRGVIGGQEFLGLNVGIPPHIYGIHYVRKGTHKRTNK